VVTVYLDQAKWIDLARALHGRADGARFRDALDVARHSVRMGLVQFPLSTGHYIETWRIGDDGRRARLAQAMIELSQGRTLARPPDLCDSELDTVIAHVLDRPPARRPWPPLGWGFAHASASSRTSDARRWSSSTSCATFASAHRASTSMATATATSATSTATASVGCATGRAAPSADGRFTRRSSPAAP
jgi:hypothetical protein